LPGKVAGGGGIWGAPVKLYQGAPSVEVPAKGENEQQKKEYRVVPFAGANHNDRTGVGINTAPILIRPREHLLQKHKQINCSPDIENKDTRFTSQNSNTDIGKSWSHCRNHSLDVDAPTSGQQTEDKNMCWGVAPGGIMGRHFLIRTMTCEREKRGERNVLKGINSERG